MEKNSSTEQLKIYLYLFFQQVFYWLLNYI